MRVQEICEDKVIRDLQPRLNAVKENGVISFYPLNNTYIPCSQSTIFKITHKIKTYKDEFCLLCNSVEAARLGINVVPFIIAPGDRESLQIIAFNHNITSVYITSDTPIARLVVIRKSEEKDEEKEVSKRDTKKK